VKECTVASKYDTLHSYTGGTAVNPTYTAPYLTMVQTSRIVQQQVFQITRQRAVFCSQMAYIDGDVW